MSEEDTCEPSMIGFRLFWILVACWLFSRESNFIRFRLIYDRKFESFLGVKLSAEETVCVIVKHFYIDFQLTMGLSRKCSDFIILCKKGLKPTARKNIWKAHTFPPNDKNNWQGQKCMLKTVIFKVSCFQTFFQNFLRRKIIKIMHWGVDFIRWNFG